VTWRNCGASLTLIAEINTRWPGRDKTSDGTIGDAAHATRASDHNPWIIVNNIGVVRARDIDKDGIDAAGLAEYLRVLGANGDRRLRPGGYVIFNRRITAPDFSGWRAYTGVNPHDKHVHVSFSTAVAGFDSTAPWGLLAPPPAPAPSKQLPPLTSPEDDLVYIRCQLTPAGPENIAILTGAMFVGLGSPNEIKDAQRAIAAGAPYQWVERATWLEFDRRSHALCDSPRPVVVANPSVSGSSIQP
jgi:hypothetical protein